jgi:hypothetical protein
MKLYAYELNGNPKAVALFSSPSLADADRFFGTIEVQEPGKECEHEFDGQECCVNPMGRGQCKRCVKCYNWIAQPKKTVTKEAKICFVRDYGDERLGEVFIPKNAKNVKPPTYEVEE